MDFEFLAFFFRGFSPEVAMGAQKCCGGAVVFLIGGILFSRVLTGGFQRPDGRIHQQITVTRLSKSRQILYMVSVHS
jgi:hypothetical protein